MSPDSNLPSSSEKPSLLDWLETFLPFRFPRIPLTRTAANLDKAAALVVMAGGENVVARIQASTSRVEARSASEQTLIEFGQAQISETPGLAERALQYALSDALKAQQNREDILRITCENLSANPSDQDATDEIDSDWLDTFKKHAETKTNSDIQQIWAKILASEIRKPGTTSLRTLQFLSTASTTDAKRVVSIFSFAISGSFIPHWAYENDRYPFSEFFSADETGVVNGVYGIGGTSTNMAPVQQTGLPHPYAVILHYFDMVGLIEVDDDTYRFQVPAMFLTEVGRSLFQISDTKTPDYSYFESFLENFINAQTHNTVSTTIKRVLLASKGAWAGNSFQISNQKILYPKN